MLSAKLPDYLIPLRLFALEAMPLDINGNIDRKALPDPFVATNAQAADGAVAEAALGTAPELADIEHLISWIWTQLLGHEAGLDDDFLDIGSNSIKALHLLERLTRHKLPLNLSDILHYRTVRNISAYVYARIKPEPGTGIAARKPLHDQAKAQHVDTAAFRKALSLYGPQQLDIEVWQMRLQHEYDKNNQRIRSRAVAGSFPFRPIQQVQFSFETPMSTGMVHLGMPITSETLVKAVERVISRHQLLRSIPYRETGRMAFREYAMDGSEPLQPSVVNLSGFYLSDGEFEKAARSMIAGLVFRVLNLWKRNVRSAPLSRFMNAGFAGFLSFPACPCCLSTTDADTAAWTITAYWAS